MKPNAVLPAEKETERKKEKISTMGKDKRKV